MRAHSIPRSSGMKALVRGVARRNHRTVARQAMRSKAVRTQVLAILKADIQKEMKLLCKKKTQSILRSRSAETLCTFSWDMLADELEEKAPNLFQVLKACVDVKRRKRISEGRRKTRITSNTVVLGVCAGVLLRHCNHHMNLIQRLIALILHAGHSAKQVLVALCLAIHTCMHIIMYM